MKIFFCTKSAIKGSQLENIFSVPKSISTDIETCFSQFFPALQQVVRKQFSRVQKGKALRLQVRALIHLEKFSFEQDRLISVEQWFPSDSVMILDKSKIVTACQKVMSEILARYDSFVQKGSGWSLKGVKRISVVFMRFKLFQGGHERDILPPKLRSCSSIVSPPKDENANCFAYCVAMGICGKKKNVSRNNTKYRKLVALMPEYVTNVDHVSLKEIEKFETEWPVSCNVYGVEKDKLFPYYVSPWYQKRQYHVQLLLDKEHYYLIRNMSAVLKKCNTVNRRKCYVCQFCLTYFGKRKNFLTHQEYCQTKGRPIQMPDRDNNKMSFSNFSNLLLSPFVIYADLESVIEKKSLQPEHLKTISKATHRSVSFASLTICRENPEFSSAHPLIYTGEDCITKFLDHIQEECSRLQTIFASTYYPIQMTPEDEKRHRIQIRCHFCLRKFSSSHDHLKKVRDHSHLSGKYRFALCSRCNLTHAKLRPKLVVILHGLCNYDSHFIIQELKRYSDDMLKVIPRTGEKYLSFSVGDVVFKDSYQFISESLAKLAENLKQKGCEYFFSLNKYIKDSQRRDLLTQKGVFPYTYISLLQVLNETQLPSKEHFFNDLTRENVTEEEYAFAEKVWKTFECKTLKDYMEIYLMADLLLLADIFENFRTNCYESYELDPLHYYSNAHFTFDAFLRFSGVSLELFTDPNMYFFISNGIRGGMSMVGGSRLIEANNKYMGEMYDPSKPSMYIMYFDCNNLYGVAMMEYLPHSNFQWVETITNEFMQKVLATSPESDEGYILEVDLTYPEEIHDWHSDYPLAPEKKKICTNDLSPFTRQVAQQHSIHVGQVEKLLTTLWKKERYVLHYRNLQLYVNLGMKLEKVHRVLKFHQRPSLREYIQFNTEKRASSHNSFDINFYKFLSNSLFGKTMERPDNKTHIRLVNSIKTYERCVSKLNFKNSKIINPDLVGIEMNLSCLKINKPFYLGMAIMDISKCHMFSFHYNVMKKFYGERLQLGYTDTDSLIYGIQTDDVYADMQQLKDHFDFSNYPQSSPLYSKENKKIPGFFKDECGGRIVEKFIGLRSKMYTIKMHGENSPAVKVAKGVKKAVIKKELSFEDYENCLSNFTELEHDFFTLKSEAHHVFTAHQSKKSLSPFDDKRWYRDKYTSFPYGHYKTFAVSRALPETTNANMSNMRMTTGANNFQVSRRNTDQPPPVYNKNLKLANKGVTHYLRVNDWKHDAYLHIKRQQDNGKYMSISFNSEEVFNLFDDKNAQTVRDHVEKCLDAVRLHYNVEPGTSQQETVEYTNMPRSQRIIEQEKEQKDSEEYEKYMDKCRKKYEESRKRKRANTDNATNTTNVTQKRTKMTSKKQLTQAEEEDSQEEEEDPPEGAEAEEGDQN